MSTHPTQATTPAAQTPTLRVHRNDLNLLSVRSEAWDRHGVILTTTRPEYAAGLSDAEATLLAAAPDLLAALERAVMVGSETCIDCGKGHAPEDHILWIAQARAAIARAKGGAA